MTDSLTLQCEYGVIGSMLIAEDCIESVTEVIDAYDFSSEICGTVFQAIVDKWRNGEKVDQILVGDGFGFNIQKFINECVDVTPTPYNAVEYAKLIKEKSIERKISDVAARIYGGDDPQECAMELAELSQGLSKNEIVKGDAWADGFLKHLAKNIESPDSAYCRTGFSQLDNLLGGGLVKGGLYILGARPGMGKTTVALNIAENVVSRGAKVLFVSLEMSSHQIMCKRVSVDCNIPYKQILTGKVNDCEYQKIIKSVGRLKDKPFVTNSNFTMNVQDIITMAKRERNCELVVVDYFGLINSPDNGKGGSRYEIYSDISRQLKQAAGMLNIPILCLAQLNREVEKGRQNKKPQLSDLRDTGSLEQDADSVIFLHRDGYYAESQDVKDENIEIIVKKNRHGDCGSVNMYWFGEYGQICAIDSTYNDEDDLYL